MTNQFRPAPLRAAAAAVALLCSLSLVAATATPASASAATRHQHKVFKRAVKSYSDKFLSGHGAAAFKMLTPRCRDKVNRHRFIQASDLAKQLYGGPMPFTSFHATFDGKKARATYTFAAKALNQTREPWRKVSGHWRNNEC